MDNHLYLHKIGICLTNRFIFVFIPAILCLSLADSCENGKKYDVYVSEPALEKDTISDTQLNACITIINQEDNVSIVKEDLLNNFTEKEQRRIILDPQYQIIPPGDSCRISFPIKAELNDEDLIAGIRNSEIVLRFSDETRIHYNFDPEFHLFQVRDEALLERLQEKIDLMERFPFKFLGEGIDRNENFSDCPYEVTLENVAHLYREYVVSPIIGTDLYLIYPDKIYTNSKFFTRIIRFSGGKQVAAHTFYYYNIPFIFRQNDEYLVALNSLATTAGYNKSTFTSKTVLLDSSLNVIREREYRYKEQQDAHYAYSWIDTLYQDKNDYVFRVVNSGFDSDDYYVYTGRLSSENIVTESSRKHIFNNFYQE